MTDALAVPTVVRCLAAVLLVLGASTVLGAWVMARAVTEAQQRRRFALTMALPLVGLVVVSMVLRGLA